MCTQNMSKELCFVQLLATAYVVHVMEGALHTTQVTKKEATNGIHNFLLSTLK